MLLLNCACKPGPAFMREYVAPNEPYSHFMLVSQSCEKKTPTGKLPAHTQCSMPDFTYLSQVVFPLTFAIFVTAAVTFTCTIYQNKLVVDLLSFELTPSITPSVHITAQRV